MLNEIIVHININTCFVHVKRKNEYLFYVLRSCLVKRSGAGAILLTRLTCIDYLASDFDILFNLTPGPAYPALIYLPRRSNIDY